MPYWPGWLSEFSICSLSKIRNPKGNREIDDTGPMTALKAKTVFSIILVMTCASAFISGYAGNAHSTHVPVVSKVASPQIMLPESPLLTATLSVASTVDVIPLPSATSQPVSHIASRIVSDTLNVATPALTSPLSPPTPTIRPTRVIAPTPTLEPELAPRPTTPSFESPLPTPSPTNSPTVQPEPTLLAPLFVSPLESPLPTATPAGELVALEQATISAVNAERQLHNLPPYQVDEVLTAIARAHAQDMARRGYMDHVTPEGKSYSDRLAEVGLTSRWRGENIVLSVRPVDEAVQDALTWWLSSAPHRRNILHPHYTHIGVGVAQTPEGWYVFVMDLVKR